MNLEQVLKKVVAGETLTQEETDFLKGYKENGGIPKDRLDREINAKKEAEEKAAQAEKDISRKKRSGNRRTNNDAQRLQFFRLWEHLFSL